MTRLQTADLDERWHAWLEANLSVARELALDVGRSVASDELVPVEILDEIIAHYFPDPACLPEDAGEVLHAVGLTVGQHMVAIEPALKWMVARQPTAPHLALAIASGEYAGDPVTLVAEAVKSGRRAFLAELMTGLRMKALASNSKRVGETAAEQQVEADKARER